jgi:hypothetical protein
VAAESKGLWIANAPVDLVIYSSSIDKDFPNAISDRNICIATFRRRVVRVAVDSNEFSFLKSTLGDNLELFDALDLRAVHRSLPGGIPVGVA